MNRGNYAENSTFPSRLSPPLFPHLIYFLPLSKGVCLVGFHVSTMPPRFSQPMLHGPLAALSYTRGRKMIALKHAKYEDKVLRLFPKFIECMWFKSKGHFSYLYMNTVELHCDLSRNENPPFFFFCFYALHLYRNKSSFISGESWDFPVSLSAVSSIEFSGHSRILTFMMGVSPWNSVSAPRFRVPQFGIFKVISVINGSGRGFWSRGSGEAAVLGGAGHGWEALFASWTEAARARSSILGGDWFELYLHNHFSSPAVGHYGAYWWLSCCFWCNLEFFYWRSIILKWVLLHLMLWLIEIVVVGISLFDPPPLGWCFYVIANEMRSCGICSFISER